MGSSQQGANARRCAKDMGQDMGWVWVRKREQIHGHPMGYGIKLLAREEEHLPLPFPLPLFCMSDCGWYCWRMKGAAGDYLVTTSIKQQQILSKVTLTSSINTLTARFVKTHILGKSNTHFHVKTKIIINSV